MKILLNTNQYCQNYKYTPFKSSKEDVLHELHDLGGLGTGAKRLAELGNAKTEAEAWKVAMKMADYGNPVRHAAWMTGAAKGAALGAFLGPLGATIGCAIGAVGTNYLCNKVRNKLLDKIADWMDE